MSYKIIVARYNENIEWLKSEMSNCIIYNKGDELNIDNEIFLENVGREAETYLHYIITNYYNLPDVVVFTQARIEDHKGSNDVNYLLNIKNEALEHNKSQNFHRDENIEMNTWNLTKDGWYMRDNYKNNKPITFIEWFKNNIDINYPYPIHVYWNAIFAVKKENITNKPIEYYKKLILEVKHNSNPPEAHFFERSWYYIFD
jgi:hypothetical protein